MEKKEQNQKGLKKFWNRYGSLVKVVAPIAVGIGVAAICNAMSNKDQTEQNNQLDLLEDGENSFDHGRDCVMIFAVEETGEVLGRVPVTESYVEDWKELRPELFEFETVK